MKNILIVEDKEESRKVLIKILEEVEEPIKIFEAGTISEAYKISMENSIHLFLVDIILNPEKRGDVSGLEFAAAIRKISYYAFSPIIFITSLEDPEMHAYRNLHCYGYVEKPFDEKMVRDLVCQALKFPQINNKNENIYFRKEGIVYSVKIAEIIFAEISRREIEIYTTKEIISMPYMTVKKLLSELGSDDFIQCNRSCIINKKYVEHIDYANRYIKLQDVDKYIEIGRKMKEKVVYEFRN